MTYDLPAIASNLSAHSFRWMRVQAVKAWYLAALLLHLFVWGVGTVLLFPSLLLGMASEKLLPNRFRGDAGVNWKSVLDTLKG